MNIGFGRTCLLIDWSEPLTFICDFADRDLMESGSWCVVNHDYMQNLPRGAASLSADILEVGHKLC